MHAVCVSAGPCAGLVRAASLGGAVFVKFPERGPAERAATERRESRRTRGQLGFASQTAGLHDVVVVGVDDDRADEALLVAGRRDAEAFGVFYRRRVDAVLAFFLRRTGDRELAADLTAETFAAALSAFRVTGRSAARRWRGCSRSRTASWWTRSAVARLRIGRAGVCASSRWCSATRTSSASSSARRAAAGDAALLDA